MSRLDDKMPLSPEILMNAIQDPIKTKVEKSRAAKSIKVIKMETLDEFLKKIEKMGCPECCGPNELFVAADIIREMKAKLDFYTNDKSWLEKIEINGGELTTRAELTGPLFGRQAYVEIDKILNGKELE